MSVPPREEIRRYVPGMRGTNSDHGIERLIILLLGFAGQGKSSLINSCICVVRDRLYGNLAGAGTHEGGKTTKRTPYQLTDTIWISDNRGFGKMESEEILEVCAQLRHLRKQEGDVKWDEDISEETINCIPESYRKPTEFILPVIVQSCLNPFSEGDRKSMETLIKKCQEITTISPVVVITRVGPANNRSGNCATIENKFGEMGCTHRICLENYTENNQIRRTEADNQFLGFLAVCMNEAEDAIQRRGNKDHQEIFAVSVANQVKEENKVKESRRREKDRELQEKWNEQKKELEKEQNKKLEEERDKVRKLEIELELEKAKPFYEKCSFM